MAEHVADFAAADADVARGHVGVRADVLAQFRHERLAEAHDFVVALALRIEVGAALAAAHGQGGQRVLEDLFEAEELQDGEVDGGMEAQAALVGADGAVELDAEAAVDAVVAGVVDPRHAEDDLAFGFDDALEDPAGLVLLVAGDDGFEGFEDFAGGLEEFRLAGIAGLQLGQDFLDVAHGGPFLGFGRAGEVKPSTR